MADAITRYPEVPADKELITITPIKCPKHEYYMEYWEIGTDHKEINQGHFHSAAIKSFIRMFLQPGKYTIVYLKNVDAERVVLDKRSTLGG